MKYLITLCLLIPSALNAMDIDQAQNASARTIIIYPIFAHVRADKNQRTIEVASVDNDDFFWDSIPHSSNSQSYNGAQLTLTEIIPNDETQQLTIYFSLKPKDNPAHQGRVITKYNNTSAIPVGDQKSKVRYLIGIPRSSDRKPDLCDCPTKEHQSVAAALALAQQSPECNTK